MTRKAENREQYIEEWESHLRQFTSVFLEANIPVTEWDAKQAEIRAIIAQAADRAFPEEAPKTLSDEQLKYLHGNVVDDYLYECVSSRIDDLLERRDDIANLIPDDGYITWKIRFDKEIQS